jgi:shikimate kinase
VERGARMSVASILAERGEPAFRALETAALRQALAGEGSGTGATRDVVLALGAGALGSEENRSLLRERAFTAWLRVDPKTAARRIGTEGAAARPLLREEPARRLRELLDARGGLYGAAANASIDTEGKTPAEVAAAVVAAWEARSGWDSSAS